MEFGSTSLRIDLVSLFMGINPTYKGSTSTATEDVHLPSSLSLSLSRVKNVDQRDASLLHFWHKVLSCKLRIVKKIAMLGHRHIHTYICIIHVY